MGKVNLTLKALLAFAAIITVTSLQGCDSVKQELSDDVFSKIEVDDSSNYIEKIHDNEARATCWLYKNGISCISDRFLGNQQ